MIQSYATDEPINFVYDDTDTYQNEISELYLYGEEGEFLNNRNAFEESMEDCGLPLTWKHMAEEQKARAINYLMTALEVSCRTTRLKSCRALAYLVQGNFGECLSLEEQATNSQENVFLLYKQGLFQAFVQQLLIEIHLDSTNQEAQQHSNSSSTQSNNNLTELSLIMSVLCTITETMYHAKDSSDRLKLELRNQFVAELQNPIGHELLSVTLFQMLNRLCGGLAPQYPVRKITLLLWKIILITLGGTQTLKELKDSSRAASNLEPLLDDTLEVTKNMRPCSPPEADGQSRSRAAFSGFNKRKVYKQPAFDEVVFAYAKECLINSVAADIDIDNENSGENGEFSNELNDSLAFSNDLAQPENNSNDSIDPYNNETDSSPDEASRPSSEAYSSDSGVISNSDSSSPEKTTTPESTSREPFLDVELFQEGVRDPIDDAVAADTTKDASNTEIDNQVESSSLRPGAKETDGSRSDVTSIYKGLPWAPKVRKADLGQHFSSIRQKFVGYTLPNDLETTFGLPDPIVEGINVLRKHLYVSLAEVQLECEEALEKFPLTHKEINPAFKDAPAEKLYCALLPRLPQYMIALLKILLAASTSIKNKPERSESINIMCEMSLDDSNPSIIQTMRANADANRHKEVIIKSVSAILLLLLKHFKINHIYQFEYVSQQLMFANCIPLILKFLSQDILSYIVSSKSNISAIDFPACVIGEQPELTTEAIELCSFQPYSWRNMFSCINLLRILNKLTKWKHSRIMMLVVFKSAPTLTKALSVRHSMFQLYVLKLLKVQLKFLGRQWKKNNMKLISAIYQKVRHRLTDDWAYSNDNEARPWDFQAEEFTLQANINKFHQRRYKSILSPNGKNPGLLFNQSTKFGAIEDGTDEDYDFGDESNLISPQFERNHEKWLESEVFQRNIDWDKLLSDIIQIRHSPQQKIDLQ